MYAHVGVFRMKGWYESYHGDDMYAHVGVFRKKGWYE